jgi:hypothetical protein
VHLASSCSSYLYFTAQTYVLSFSVDLGCLLRNLITGCLRSEKLEFNVPVSFTIGPRDAPDSLIKYAKYLSASGVTHLTELMIGIIEGEARVLAAELVMEQV